ncbi:mRNA splicing protein prp18 [Tulasnella sp. 331]|nr:mRNA splicing protein prp18 [Tulasnella sp. 331]
MDFLKAEIAGKRKALDDTTARPNKYMRKGDVEKMKEQELRKQKEEQERAKRGGRKQNLMLLNTSEPSVSRSISPAAPEDPSSSNALTFNIPNEDAIRRLRAKGQPIRLFGESDKDRRLRLRALELIEENDAAKDGGGGLNDFKRVMAGMESGLDAKEAEKKMLSGKPPPVGNQDQTDVEKEVKAKRDEKAREGKGQQEPLDLTLVERDPNALYPLIYRALKDVLHEWAGAMDQREEHIKRSTAGKHAAGIQVSSAEYLKPLFRTLKQRNLPKDVLARLAEIVHYMQARQYQRANDSYLRLSIGNAAWPIGVTMVGIHERSAREKISTDQVAHVLNDENASRLVLV